jgi:PPOX class probable F420-dependent enzyme
MPEGMSVLAEGQFGRRVRECLEIESVIWLTAVGADGTPRPNRVWFFGQQEGFLIYNRSGANRLARIACRPKASLNFDGDTVVFTGPARRLEGQPPLHELPAYRDKSAKR